MSSSDVIIRIESVSKTYGESASAVQALRDVSLNVLPGEFLSIIGPSGCGKSTLLKLIADLMAPSTGRIAIKGRSPSEARQARDCGIVFQSPTLLEWRSVEKNIDLPLEILGTPPAEQAKRTEQLLELIRLRDFAAHFPRELSVGMQQQVSIARALAYGPSILLMDEPFGSLDELTRERLGRELLELWERTRVTILFVTHSVDEAVMLSDRVAVLSPRPGHIDRVISIDLPRPRTPEMRESVEYLQCLREVRAALHLNGKR